MKRILLVMLLSISFTAYCQPKGTEVTMLEKLFSKGVDIVGKITQEKDGSRRELVPYKSKKEESIKKYLLTEYNNKETVTASAYIVSKNDIQKDYPLFDIKLGNKHIINIDKLNQTEDNKLQGKLTVKINDDYINVTESVAKLPINTEAPGEICVDHWWVSWVVETGEIIEIVNMGSDCYTFGEPSTEGGGGGNNPSPQNTCNMTCEEATEVLNSIILTQTSGSVSYDFGGQTIEPDGVIKKPCNPKQGLASIEILPTYSPEYTAFFKGVIYKEDINTKKWKWESCAYNYTAQTGGAVPMCFEVTHSVNASDCVFSDDKTDAATEINFQFHVTVPCLLGNPQSGINRTGNQGCHFNSNSIW